MSNNKFYVHENHNYNYLQDKNEDIDISKRTTVSDIIYKPKDLLGFSDKGIKNKTNDTIKNLNSQTHKILNVFLRTLHNTLFYDKTNGKRYRFYRSDMDEHVYVKIDLKDLITETGVSIKTKSLVKDIRFFRETVLSMSGMYLKSYTDDIDSSTPIFNQIRILNSTEEVFISFKDEVIKAMLNNYTTPIVVNGKDGYITLPINKINKSEINQYGTMLYEYISCNIYDFTLNEIPKDVNELFSFIGNDKGKFSQRYERMFLKAVESLEEHMGLKVFYIFEKTINNRSVKNVRLKVFKTDSYVKLESSEKLDIHIPHISSVENEIVFKYVNELVLLNSINNLDDIKNYKTGFKKLKSKSKPTVYTKSDIKENIVDEIILDSNGNEMYESWLVDENGMPLVNGEDLWGDDN